jgi:hypothetical protein
MQKRRGGPIEGRQAPGPRPKRARATYGPNARIRARGAASTFAPLAPDDCSDSREAVVREGPWSVCCCFSKQLRPPPRGYGRHARRAAPTTARGGGVSTRAPTGPAVPACGAPAAAEGTHSSRPPTSCAASSPSDLERELAAHADLLRGLAWRRGRFGTPTGRVGLHVAPILARIGGYPRMRRSAPGKRMKARSSPSYNVSSALRSFSASSRNPRTIPNTAWRIVAWPKARRLAASFGSSLRAGW